MGSFHLSLSIMSNGCPHTGVGVSNWCWGRRRYSHEGGVEFLGFCNGTCLVGEQLCGEGTEGGVDTLTALEHTAASMLACL